MKRLSIIYLLFFSSAFNISGNDKFIFGMGTSFITAHQIAYYNYNYIIDDSRFLNYGLIHLPLDFKNKYRFMPQIGLRGINGQIETVIGGLNVEYLASIRNQCRLIYGIGYLYERYSIDMKMINRENYIDKYYGKTFLLKVGFEFIAVDHLGFSMNIQPEYSSLYGVVINLPLSFTWYL
jgi:hypothetical protein